MWKRLSLLWSLLKGDLQLVWRALQHPQSPPWFKWGVGAVALYLIAPIDVIPDFFPIIGMMDDLVIVPMALRWLLQKLPARVREDIARPSASAASTRNPPSGQKTWINE